MSLTTRERMTILMMRGYGDKKRSYQEVADLFNDENPNRLIPVSKSTIFRTVNRCVQTGSLEDAPRSGRPQTATNEENSLDVLLTIEENANTSSRRVSQQIGISQGSIIKILHLHHFHPYKMKLVQELSDDDFDRRLEFCEGMMARCDNANRFLFWTCFSDEATFQLSGQVNRHNMRYWATDNPYWMRKIHTQYPQKLNVWAGILCNKIVGPFFIDGNLNAQKYLDLLNNSIIPAIRNIVQGAFDNVWFQQDGAQPHYALIVRDFLNNIFPEKWIGRRGAVEWPPRSPDLTPLDFFYWGYLKGKVYETKPTDIDDLRERICNVSSEISANMLQNVTNQHYVRFSHCQLKYGGHFEHITNK